MEPFTNWNLIEEWISSQYPEANFSNMPISFKLDKESSLKIMKGKLFGYDSDYIYKIRDLPENLKSDIDVAILAIELYSDNFFEISEPLRESIGFHKLLIQNARIDYKFIFDFSPTSIRGNKDYVNQIISVLPAIYNSLTDELRADKDVVTKVLEKKFFPERLPIVFSNDKKIILKLIEVTTYNQSRNIIKYKVDWLLSFISKELLSDRGVLLKLFKSFKHLSIVIPDNFKNDYELIINAVKCNPSYYETIDDNFKTDPRIAIETFKLSHSCFLNNITKYKFEYSTVLDFIKSLQKPSDHEINAPFQGRGKKNKLEIFEEVVDKLMNIGMFKDEIALHLVSIWPNLGVNFVKYFKIFNPQLQKNKNVLMKLLEHSISEQRENIFGKWIKGDTLTTKFVYENYIKPNHSDDKDLILKTLSYEPSLFPSVPDILKTGEEIIIETSRRLSDDLRDKFLISIEASYWSNESFILKLLETPISSNFDDSLFKFASLSLRDDNDFVREAIKIQPQSIMYASDRIKNDIAFQRLAFNTFQRVRKDLRLRHRNLKVLNRIPFCNGLSDDELDKAFHEKHCIKLSKNKFK